jgi:protein gp37
MALCSKIEWTESTWNPVTGCTRISLGCENCYAERMARRLQAMGQPKYKNGFEVTVHPDVLEDPLHWKNPRMVFVNSMGDLFHKSVSDKFIGSVFKTMRGAPRHIFQILTKRTKRLAALSGSLEWPENIWMGVTVENQNYRYRIDDLRKIPAAMKWLSLEPLLGPIADLDLAGIDWIVVGGESGFGARPMKEEWVLDIQRQCKDQNVAFFFKQWGGINKKKTGRLLLGRTWDEMPMVLQQYQSHNQFRLGL